MRGRVTAIETGRDGVAASKRPTAAIATRTVVNAAGPWAAVLPNWPGVDLPVEPLRRMLVPTEPFDKVSQNFADGGGHGDRVSLSARRPGTSAGLEGSRRDSRIQSQVRPLVHRKNFHARRRPAPGLAEAEVNPRRAWAGLYEMTPDHHSVLGAVPEVRGLFFANGFSGHGVMHSPATGRILADLILTGRCELVDTALLSIDRFATGRLMHETAVL